MLLIFALLACQFGARKVYAIEPDSAIQVAREIAAANGYAERIEFMQNFSTRQILPERADVIISDLRGVLPLFQDHIPCVADARERFSRTRRPIDPQRDTLWMAVVEAPDLYESFVGPWHSDGYGLDIRIALPMVTNMWRKARITPEHLLAEPQSWATIDYATVVNPDVSGAATSTTAGPARVTVSWFGSMQC
jgi:protein arginine N-methyltransferase 1